MILELDEFSVKKINLIDKFRERFSSADNEKLKLPQIIVVGDQSSGKSSILEAISGVKLPRGVNTVTKCPLIIQMRHSNVEKKQIQCKDYVNMNVEHTDKEIERVQREVLNNELTNVPITLHIESPNVPTLTIIDLPGIVKTKTVDHAEGIVEMTEMIAKNYMKQENSLIICVSPANQDISTTTTIKLASECNKSMSRIIGVITKLDKIEGEEVSLIPDILQNKKLPIKKGYYGLIVSNEFLALDSKNRELLEKEKFIKMDLLTDQLKDRLGLTKLTTALVNELMVLINDCLPKLKENIIDLTVETKNDLSRFSKYHNNTELQTDHLNQIANGIVAKVDRVLVNPDSQIHKYSPVVTFLKDHNYLNPIGPHATFLHMWASIFTFLYKEFRAKVKELFELKSSPYKDVKALDNLLKECRVDYVSHFNNSKPFKIVIDNVLEIFKSVSMTCVDKCCNIIKNLIENVFVIDIDQNLSLMKQEVSTFCLEILNTQDREIRSMLDYQFESEQSYFSQDETILKYFKKVKSPETPVPVPVSNPIKMNTSQSMSTIAMQKMNEVRDPDSWSISSQKSGGDVNIDDSDNQAKRLKDYLDKYIANLVLRLGDSIPNFIRLTLFVKFKKTLDEKLFSYLNKEERRLSYFSLNEAEMDLCTKLKARLEALNQSRADFDKLKHPNIQTNGFRTDSL